MAFEDAYGAPGGWWGAAGTGVGALGDIYAFLNNLKARQQSQQIYEIMSNPAKLASYVNKFFQPMGAAENTAVQRDLGANWATMTGGAPGGAMNQFIADALAKIESQRYQSATGSAINTLQGAGREIPGQQPIGLMGNILKQLMTLKGIGGQQQPSPTGITLPSTMESGGPYQAPPSPFPAPTTADVPV